jgi:hypothetical protein
MLNKEEEHKLTEIKLDVEADLVYGTVLDTKELLERIEWLAIKLKETNDECSKVTEELYKVNEAYAKATEM